MPAGMSVLRTNLMTSYNNVAAKLPRYYLTVTQVNGYAATPSLGGAEPAQSNLCELPDGT